MKGTYKAVIEDHALAMIGKNQTPAIKFKLTVSENMVTGEPVNPFTVYYDGFLTEAAWENTFKNLEKSIGWTGSDLNDFNGTGKYSGVEVSVVLEEEEYNGKVQTKVKFMNNVNGVGGKLTPADSGIARGIAESMKGKILSYRQKNQPTNEGGF